jgi:multidrug efflux system membrane fusion protein
LKALFPNKGRQLWPGTFVNAEVVTSIVNDALTVPTDAVQQNDSGQFVYVIEAGNKVAIRHVEIVQRIHGIAIVSRDLQPGETVVVQGQYRLVPGAVVIASTPAEVPNTSTATAGMLP